MYLHNHFRPFHYLKQIYLTHRWILTGTKTLDQSWPGSNDNEGMIQYSTKQFSIIPRTTFFRRSGLIQLTYFFERVGSDFFMWEIQGTYFFERGGWFLSVGDTRDLFFWKRGLIPFCRKCNWYIFWKEGVDTFL